MALATRKVIDQHPVVCSFDPCVHRVQTSSVTTGWIPLAAARCDVGATVVTVRPLNIMQRAHVDDAGDRGAINKRLLAFAREGIVSVGEFGSDAPDRTDPAAIHAWLDSLEDSSLVVLLGAYVSDITAGRDPSERQALFTGQAPKRAEGGE